MTGGSSRTLTVPAAASVTFCAPVDTTPAVNTKAALTVTFDARLTPGCEAAVLLIVRFWNVVAPVMVWAAAPLKITVLVAAVNVPLFVKFPANRCVNVLALKAPELIRKFPATMMAPAAVLVLAAPLKVRLP